MSFENLRSYNNKQLDDCEVRTMWWTLSMFDDTLT